VTVPYAALRCFIERVAHVAATADAVKGLITAPVLRDTPLKPLLELNEVIMRALYGTQRSWTELTKVDFRQASPKEVAYPVKEEFTNMKATNVLTAVDKLNKLVTGARLP